MIDLIITGIVTLLSIGIGCIYLKADAVNNQKNISAVLPKNKKQAIFGFGYIISILAVFLILVILYDCQWTFVIKRVIFCSALWPLALIDYRKHIIPNKILLCLVIIRVVIAILEMIMDFKTATTELLGCVIAAVGILVLLCIMRLIIKEGIGFGDIKLFVVMGLYYGIRGSVSSLFLSFVVSFVVSIFMLITKRKNRKDYIAFAPSILVGTLLSTLIVGA